MLQGLMFNCLYTFLEMNSVIYDLQFRFRQKYSTFHALIHLIDRMREELSSGNFACGKFVDFQKSFVSIPIWNIFIVVFLKVLFWDHYYSLFNCAIRYYSVHHFAEDTNLLNYNNSVKRVNDQVNQELKKFKKLAESK